ncbi:hypothetical protein [Halorubrum lacusprofundi]|jgi:hypothetical protein|uniref:Rpa-associated protein n=1 Tax=Halorubrum lacusprofundi (strain ATCC 49239 / DSM 5036 / JCM 8891 / ACAM 34) TaxID=416348 RepID=B9LTU2_HALLT|nr:hypothetical protein [Halorubrum lacusprofundi]ACM56226.1 conserved hypothetical protein [Halorubrum lacusprofundi ATCC 49239]MCG1005465.1 hypothetical protein [Halorubrum lacusprofundi]
MSDDGPGAREVAHRVFAAEFDDASLSYSESDEERAPNYVVTPTGARVNRLFVAGVLTEVERVNDETRRGRVVDPSGAFVTYAGQYQPEAQTFLERAEPPAFVALTGKARTFEPEDSDRVFTSVRPESLNAVDADTRDRWVVSAAEATLDRLAVFAKALDSELRGEELRVALETGGAPAALAAGIPKAIAHYDTSTAYVEALRRLAVDALKLIAGDRDEVRSPDIAPDAGGEAAIGALPETDVTIEAPAEPVADDGAVESESESVAAESDESASEPEPNAESEPAVTGDETADSTEADSTETDSTETDSTETDSIETDTEDTAVSVETEPSDSGSDAAGSVDAGPGSADSESDDESGGLGDFDAGTDDTETDESGTDDAEADLDEPSSEPGSDEMYQLDDEEREEIESEFGTDFSTGTEVDEPGEADIDVPDPEEIEESPTSVGASESAGADAPAGSADEAAAEPTTDSEPESEEPAGDETSDADADIDLEAAVIDAMGALDDGAGADREAVVEAVVDDHGVAADAVEDAIQDALMSGKCYEPGDGTLKPI